MAEIRSVVAFCSVYVEGHGLARGMREISGVIEMFCVLTRIWGMDVSICQT